MGGFMDAITGSHTITDVQPWLNKCQYGPFLYKMPFLGAFC